MAIPLSMPGPTATLSARALPVAAPFFALGAGLALRAAPLQAIVMTGILGAAACLVLHWLARAPDGRGHFLLALLPAAALLAGVAAGAGARPESGPAVPAAGTTAEPVVLAGTVLRVAHLHGNRRVRLALTEVAGQPAHLVARLALPDGAPEVLPGDHLAGTGRLRLPEPPHNPGAPDPRDLLSRMGIDAVGRFDRVARIESPASSFAARAALGRAAVRARAEDAARAIPGDGSARAGVLRALAMGEGAAVPPAVRARFATAGLSHLLAVSGLHLGLVAACLFALLRRGLLLGPWRRRAGAVAAVLTAPMVGLAVVWVEHPPSASRAGLMAIVLLAAVVLRRRLDPWQALALAAVCLVALDPRWVLQPGFQLSFAAVAGILALGVRALADDRGETPGRLRRPLRRLGRVGAVTLAAALATAPLCALHFGRVPLAGNVANLVAVPLAGVLVPIVAAATTLTLVAGEVADPIWWIAAWGAEALIRIADGAAALPLSSVPAPPPGPFVLAASGAGLLLAATGSGVIRRLLAVGLVLLPLLGGEVLPARRSPGAPLEVTFLAVGHGDAVLVRTSRGDLLVDAGGDPSGRFDVGTRQVVPALRALGVRRLAAVFVSHPHLDHYGGLFAVLDALPVDRLYHTGEAAAGSGPYAALVDHARDRGVPLHLACRDPLPDVAPVRLTCLFPEGAGASGTYDPVRAPNDNSIVLRVALGDVAFLLTGDVEAEAEARLVESPAALAATVVKAPHHGSATSSSPAFVAATGARHVVFSSGPPGRFDFPDRAVVTRWQAHGATGWWTHHHGAVTFRTDGRTLEIRPFREGTLPWPAPAAQTGPRTGGPKSGRPAHPGGPADPRGPRRLPYLAPRPSRWPAPCFVDQPCSDATPPSPSTRAPKAHGPSIGPSGSRRRSPSTRRWAISSSRSPPPPRASSG